MNQNSQAYCQIIQLLPSFAVCFFLLLLGFELVFSKPVRNPEQPFAKTVKISLTNVYYMKKEFNLSSKTKQEHYLYVFSNDSNVNRSNIYYQTVPDTY